MAADNVLDDNNISSSGSMGYASKVGEWMKELDGIRSSKKRFMLNPESTALLVIDVQKFFADPESHAFVPDIPNILPNINGLIRVFRNIEQPVIYTRHAYLKEEEIGIMGQWWGDNIMDSDPLSELASEIYPLPHEPVIRKTRYSAFIGTGLESLLQEKGIDTIVLAGVVTHLCCESTAREAFMKDFLVYTVVDGMASYSDKLHLGSLRGLATGFSIPITTAEVSAAISIEMGVSE